MMLFAVRRPPVLEFDLGNAVLKAIYASDLNIDLCAQTMGISGTLLSRQIRGEEHLSLQRLLLIRDPRFWVSLLGSIADYVGANLSCESLHLRRDVMRLLVQLNRFSVSMLKRDAPVSERKRA